MFKVWNQYGIPTPVREYMFHPIRQWRADLAWPEHKIILEIEGGVFSQGRHTRGKGFIEDIAKYNAAAALGYRVFRCVPQSITIKDPDVRLWSDAIKDLLVEVFRGSSH